MRRPVIFGNYVLLERISVGGMAEVFKAKSFGIEGFEKILAIKRILPSMAEDEDFISMFIDEAKISGQLSHANIAQIYELGMIEASHFIAMEFVWGKDVLQLQNRFRRLQRKMLVPMAVFIANKVCEGLDYAHRKRDPHGMPLDIIHRDISPQNVLVSYEGDVKLIDFGIAKAAARTAETQAGVLKGKFGYMSPEQVRGLPLDRRSDIFAIGTLLWEMCVGERLFAGDSDFAILEKVRNAIVQPPSSQNPMVPPELDTIIMRALKRDVEDRYSWASEMQEALQEYLETQTDAFGADNLSQVLKEFFGREIDRERVAMEKYRRIKREDVEMLAAGNPHETGERQAVSLLGLDGAGIDDDATTGERELADAEVAALLAPEDLEVNTPLPEEFDDGATELGGPEFLAEHMPGGELDAAATQIFSDHQKPVAGEATFIFDAGSEGQAAPDGQPAQPTMIFSELEQQARQSNFGMAAEASVVYSAANTGSLRHPASGTVAVPAPQSSLFKDILIGVLAAAVLVLLAMVGYSVLTKEERPPSTTLVINLRGKQAAEVVVNGRSYGRVLPGKPLPISDLSGGAHRVALVAGDKPIVKTIHLSPGKNAVLDFELDRPEQPKPKAAYLTLSVEPPLARVKVDGTPIGAAELSQPLRFVPGRTHRVVVSREGFASAQLEVVLEDGRRSTKKVKLQDAKTGAVRVVTEPASANVIFDGKQLGKAPMWIEDVAPGRHRIEVMAEGHKPHKASFRMRPGKALERVVKLDPEQQKPVTGSSQDKAGASSKGSKGAQPSSPPRVIGSTEPPKVKEPLPPREAVQPKERPKKKAAATKAKERVGGSSKAPKGKKARPKEGAKVKVVRAPKPAAPRARDTPLISDRTHGYLVANTTPWARVFVDGRDTGRTTPIPPKSRIALRAGRHRVAFFVEGKRYIFMIRIKAGQVTRLIKELQ